MIPTSHCIGEDRNMLVPFAFNSGLNAYGTSTRRKPSAIPAHSFGYTGFKQSSFPGLQHYAAAFTGWTPWGNAPIAYPPQSGQAQHPYTEEGIGYDHSLYRGKPEHRLRHQETQPPQPQGGQTNYAEGTDQSDAITQQNFYGRNEAWGNDGDDFITQLGDYNDNLTYGGNGNDAATILGNYNRLRIDMGNGNNKTVVRGDNTGGILAAQNGCDEFDVAGHKNRLYIQGGGGQDKLTLTGEQKDWRKITLWNGNVLQLNAGTEELYNTAGIEEVEYKKAPEEVKPASQGTS